MRLPAKAYRFTCADQRATVFDLPIRQPTVLSSR